MDSTKLPKLEDRTIFEKIVFVLEIILSIAVIILSILDLADVLTITNVITNFLLGSIFFLKFIECKKYNRVQAYLSLVTSLFIFLLGFSNLFI